MIGGGSKGHFVPLTIMYSPGCDIVVVVGELHIDFSKIHFFPKIRIEKNEFLKKSFPTSP
jgi:hypothetical protein